jgi:hypothetical protein
VSLAYNILRDPTSRAVYDLNPLSADMFANPPSPDDTFDGVLQVLLADFMSGDFEIIRVVLRE